MTDLQLRQDVIDELDFDPRVESAHIGVAVDKGIVTLTGHVSSYAEKLAAEAAARRVEGVRALVESIDVRLPNHKKRADDEIAARVADILNWDSRIPKGLRIKVKNGCVYLEGEVEWQFQRAAAEGQVSKLSGLVSLVNNVTIKPRPKTPDIRRHIEDAFRRHAAIDAERIHIAVEEGKVRIEGNVHSWSERAAAENAVWSVPGVSRVESNLRIV